MTPYINRIRIKSEILKHAIKADDGPLIGSTTPTVDLGAYIFKDLNTGKIKPEESFTEDYI